MRVFAIALLMLFSVAATAAPRAEKISWKHGKKTFDGYLVWDDSTNTPRPGLLMTPNWYGVNASAIEKAKTLAGDDYVILLVDMYGRGVRPRNADEAGKEATGVYSDNPRLRGRINAALATLRGAGKRAPVDTTKIGAIGFCFGGAVTLELVRSGAELSGAATFHANLATTAPAKAGELKAPVLVMNGADDSFVPAEQIAGFEKEMRDAGADWQFVNFGGAVHCFAEPDEDGSVLKGCKYHAPSYRRSLAMMHDFFGEAFAR